MDITPLVEQGSKIIQGYGSGKFRVSGEVYETAIAVFPDRVESWDFSGDPASPEAADFKFFFEMKGQPDVVLLGGGAVAPLVSAEVRQAFSASGMALEPMDTGAACRTYNVLMAEGRLVAALLLPV